MRELTNSHFERFALEEKRADQISSLFVQFVQLFKGRYCPTTANRGRKWYQSIGILKLPGWPFSFFNFKGTPSRVEHKTIRSIFTTIELASTIIKSDTGANFVIIYLKYRCTVPRRHRTAMVQWHVGTVKLLCGPIPVHCTLMIVTVDRRRPARENVQQSRSPYSSCTVPTWHRTEHRWW